MKKKKHPKILVVNTSVDKELTEHVANINNLLEKTDYLSEIIHYTKFAEINLDDYFGIILSPAATDGNDNTKSIHNELEHIKERIKKIKQYKKPVLGICRGHQLIGTLYNSTYIEDKEKEVGENCIVEVIVENDLLFNGIQNKKIRVTQAHNNSISLPEDFKLLATSSECTVQIMKHNTKPIYSTQFHLEKCEPLFRNYTKFLL